MATRRKEPERGDSAADDEAFARAMADVMPLDADPREKVRVLPPARVVGSRLPAGDSDSDAFARAMADVVPLRPDPRGRVRPTPTVAVPQLPGPIEDAEADVPADFIAANIDRRELRRLKRGAYPVEDRRDLHGMTATEASADVSRYLENSRHQRRRCVCIVHGRGLHTKDRVAVLKVRVREILSTSPLVLAWADAPPSDGGTGAVYVLIRR
jgi:DNA-nicking Smr family endonuclease